MRCIVKSGSSATTSTETLISVALKQMSGIDTLSRVYVSQDEIVKLDLPVKVLAREASTLIELNKAQTTVTVGGMDMLTVKVGPIVKSGVVTVK